MRRTWPGSKWVFGIWVVVYNETHETRRAMTTELQRLFALFLHHFARDGKTRRQIVRIDLIINLFPVTSLTRDKDFQT